MTKRSLYLASLDTICEADGSTGVRVNVTCHSTEDIDDIIAWLELAKAMAIKWQEIREVSCGSS